MTSKTTTLDTRATTQTSCGQALVGTYLEKIQDGANSPRNTLGQLILQPNPYSLNYTHETTGVISWRRKTGNDQETTYSGTVPACFGPFAPTMPRPFDANDEIKLVEKLASRARGHQFNGALAFAETDKTIKMIGQTAMTLGRSFSLLKRGRISEAISTVTGRKATGKELKRFDPRVANNNLAHSEVAGQNWLALQYGWLPLIGDVQDGAYAINAYIRGRKNVSHARRRLLGTGRILDFTPVGVVERRLQYVWLIEEYGNFLDDFGLQDVASVAWERLPWSFVVDWFIPIQSFLSAQQSLRTLKGTSVRTETVITSNEGKIGDSATYEVAGVYHAKTVQVTRSVQPISSIRLAPPVLKNPVSLGHTLNAIALLQGVFKGNILIRR